MSERPARYIVAVGSGKGGVGKSTAAIPLDPALATVDGVVAQREAFDAVAGHVLDALQRRTAA